MRFQLSAFAILSLPLFGAAHASGAGYWEFLEIRREAYPVEERGDKNEFGISQYGRAADHYLDELLVERNHGIDYQYRWEAPSWFAIGYRFEARLRWDPPPPILIPGRQYRIGIAAETRFGQQPVTSHSDSSLAHFGAALSISQLNHSVANLDALPSPLTGRFDFTTPARVEIFSASDGSRRLADQNELMVVPPEIWPTASEWVQTAEGWQEVFKASEAQYFAIGITGGSRDSGSSGKMTLLYVYRWVDSSDPPPEAEPEPDTPEIYRPALRLVAAGRDLVPDGQSTLEMTATLYEYLPGKDDSARPLAGAAVTFTVIETYGVQPGTLSPARVLTDANGQARVTYTAPEAAALRALPSALPSAMIMARAVAQEMEDGVSVYFRAQRGEAWAEPAMGIHSSTAVVPPDRRYPALITARIEDADLEPLADEWILFSIPGDAPRGLLRNRQGQEATSVMARTDRRGLAEVQYFYAANEAPSSPTREKVQISSKQMARPAEVEISTGLNLVFERIESAYEGRGIVNAGESVPLRITVRDEWNPGLDIHQILSFWGPGGSWGDTPRLELNLEIENLATVPNYLLDALRLESHGEPRYSALVAVRAFEQSGVRNILWERESSLRTYGFPRVRPPFSGENTYHLRVALVDTAGQPIHAHAHPRSTAFLGVPTDLPADALSLFLLTNPLGPHTPEARLARTILSTFSLKIGGTSWGGFGLLVALADAAHAINTGDTQALLELAVGEIKGQVFGDIADGQSSMAGKFTSYNNLTIAEKYASLALTSHDDQGLVTQIEARIIAEIASASLRGGRRLVILYGDGSQALRPAAAEPTKRPVLPPAAKSFLSRVARDIAETAELVELVENLAGDAVAPALFPSTEGQIIEDPATGVTSLKRGGLSLYLLPPDLKYQAVETKRILAR